MSDEETSDDQSASEEPSVSEASSEVNKRNDYMARRLQTRRKSGVGSLFLPKVSDRENWWRKTMSTAPSASHYKAPPDFIELILKKRSHYHELTPGRDDAQVHAVTGKMLLPGAYQHSSFLDDLKKKRQTYSFKSTPRSTGHLYDKTVNAGLYSYDPKPLSTCTMRKNSDIHFAFNSSTPRFQDYTKGSPVLGPTIYDVKSSLNTSRAITSSFKGSYPRFPVKTNGADISGSGGYEALKRRTNDGHVVCKAFEEYAKARAKAEEDYGKAIQSATKRLANIQTTSDSGSTLRTAVEVLREESERMAVAHFDNAQQFHDSAQRMKEFTTKQKTERSSKERTLENIKTDKMRQLRENKDMKIFYDRKSEELDQARNLYSNAKPHESQYATREWDKIEKSLRKAEEEAQKAKILYRRSVEALEALRNSWEKNMEEYCELTESLEEARIKMLQNEIWLISNVISSACVNDDEYCERIRLKVEAIDTSYDLYIFIETFKTGTERPGPVRFEEYRSVVSHQSGSSSTSGGGGVMAPHESHDQRYQPLPSRPSHSSQPPPPGRVPNQQQQPIVLHNKSYQQ